MTELLDFNNDRVQNLLVEFSAEVMQRGLVKSVRQYALRWVELLDDSPTTDIIQRALGAETLFAVWDKPIQNSEAKAKNIVKVDSEGVIVPGSATHVGTYLGEHVVTRWNTFNDEDLALVALFGQKQDELPWEPNTKVF